MNKLLKVSVLTLCLLVLAGCNTLQRIQSGEITGKFDDTFETYSKHLRWSHYKVLTSFMTPEKIGPALEKAESLKGRRVSSVKPVAWVLDAENKVMVGDVVIDYYIVDRGLIRSTTQHQTWRFDGNAWKLDNGLPDLQ